MGIFGSGPGFPVELRKELRGSWGQSRHRRVGRIWQEAVRNVDGDRPVSGCDPRPPNCLACAAWQRGFCGLLSRVRNRARESGGRTVENKAVREIIIVRCWVKGEA